MRALLLLTTAALMAQDRTITSEADVVAIAFSKDGSTVAGQCTDNKLRLWDARTGAPKKTIEWRKDERLAALPSGTGLVAISRTDGSIEFRDLETGQQARQYAAVQRRGRRIAASPDGSAIAGSTRLDGNSRDEVMRMWDATGKERFSVPSGTGGTSAMALSPDGMTLAAGSYDTNIRVWNARNGELRSRIQDQLVSMFAMDFTPDGRFLVAAGVERTVYFYDTRNWRVARKFTGQPEMISSLAISADGKLLATGGFSEFTQENPVKILLRDLGSGNIVRTLDAPRIVGSLAFSPDSKWLAAAHGRKAIQVWAAGAK
ncbi:MAG: WD40 repeat domain-containing protein [Acidobacteria bacterium]|nr:WD40 repeat domain-containing protein [Acidobacteriota bacterium]